MRGRIRLSVCLGCRNLGSREFGLVGLGYRCNLPSFARDRQPSGHLGHYHAETIESFTAPEGCRRRQRMAVVEMLGQL